MLQDETLTCVCCGDRFVWTAGEQAFYASKELTPPKRCEPCRRARRLACDTESAERRAAPPRLSRATRWPE